jgi:hypothetical protein
MISKCFEKYIRFTKSELPCPWSFPFQEPRCSAHLLRSALGKASRSNHHQQSCRRMRPSNRLYCINCSIAKRGLGSWRIATTFRTVHPTNNPIRKLDHRQMKMAWERLDFALLHIAWRTKHAVTYERGPVYELDTGLHAEFGPAFLAWSNDYRACDQR